MKSKITYSRFSWLLTFAVFVVLLVGCIATFHETAKFFILLGMCVVLIISALLYGAAYIKVDENYIVLGSFLRTRKIPLHEVESVEIFQPTMGAIRLCASGGFMGYWGLFREGDIGRYYGFYGKASECFLVRLKSGGKYVLGCSQPRRMVEYIKSRI